MQDVMGIVAKLMALSAKTAPRTRGQDFIEVKVLEGEDVKTVGRDMVSYGKSTGKKSFIRDGKNVEDSDSLVLVAVKGSKTAGLNCGACGYSKCNELPDANAKGDFEGPLCAWRLVDIGIAIGSAVKTASILNADNRIMYSVGVIAKQKGLIEGEVAIGIPISATGKNIYFDRK